jgi:pantetheine-phosphate adenylyltransferase
MKQERIAIYPGSFDPVTNGHLDVVRRATRLFDKVIIAVGINAIKDPVFTPAERMDLLRQVLQEMPGVEVASFSGLLKDAVPRFGACAVIRGLRAVSDFEWEFQMALMNRELDERCETIFLMPSPEYSFVSSTMIKEVARLGGDVRPFVPQLVVEAMRRRFER